MGAVGGFNGTTGGQGIMGNGGFGMGVIPEEAH
jgi:hypothetical protein